MISTKKSLLAGLTIAVGITVAIDQSSLWASDSWASDSSAPSSPLAKDLADTTSSGTLVAEATLDNKAAPVDSHSTMPIPRDPSGKLPPVLDPNKFFGQAQAGYAACKEIPEICDKLFCYCGCDLTDCHGSLLDCFTNEHGEDCHICQEEAIIALRMHKKGKSLSDIQKEIDKKFQKEYPFEVESPTLQKYKASRLWDVGRKKTAPAGKLGTVQPGSGALDENGQPKRKLKPDGSCCAGND